MATLSHQQKVLLSNHYGIVLCHAKDEKNQPLFHYVMAEKGEMERLYRDYDLGTPLDFTSYGQILYSGWGEPTEEEADMVKKAFFQN